MDEHEMRRLMYTAQLPGKGTFVIRYPRGKGVLTDWRCPFEEIPVGTARRLREGERTLVMTIGPIGNNVKQIIDDNRLSVGHYDMRFLKPMDEDALRSAAEHYSRIVTIEDGVKNGGLGSAVTEWLNDNGYSIPVVRMGLPDAFVEHGTVDQLRRQIGMDDESIKNEIMK